MPNLPLMIFRLVSDVGWPSQLCFGARAVFHMTMNMTSHSHYSRSLSSSSAGTLFYVAGDWYSFRLRNTSPSPSRSPRRRSGSMNKHGDAGAWGDQSNADTEGAF